MTPTFLSRRPLPRPSSRRERGVSLIIAMLMLVIIGLVSAAIMRNATSTDQAVTNNRMQTQANQFAQLALQFCENQITLTATAQTVPPAPVATPASWTVKNNWLAPTSPYGAYTLKSTDMSSAVSPTKYPQCLSEHTSIANVYTVTARGFSADYTADSSTGVTQTGSVVWLQSTVLAN